MNEGSPDRATGAAARAPRWTALDGVRGLCACLVVAYHLPVTAGIGGTALVRDAWAFVDLFFVLSGMVIYRSTLGDGRRAACWGWRRFLGRRARRLLPLHGLMMLLFLAANVALATAGLRHDGRGAFTPPDDPRSFVVNLLLLQNFVSPDLGWNVPSWSIAAEAAVYLLFALGRATLGARLPWAAAAGAAASLALLAALPGHHIAVFGPPAMARALLGFATGMLCVPLLARIAARGRSAPGAAATAVEALAALATGAFVALAPAVTGLTLAAPAVFAVLLVVLADGRGRVAALLRTRAFQAIGRWSYAIYIGHFLIVQRLLPRPLDAALGTGWRAVAWRADLALALALALSVGLGWVLTAYAEPALAGAARRLGGRARAPLDRVLAGAI